MATPQSAIIPDHCLAAICIEANILVPEKIQSACTQALESLEKAQCQFPEQLLGLTIAFGKNFWDSLNHHDEAKELKNFYPLGGGLAPATQYDLFFHIQSLSHDANFTLVMEVLSAFDGLIEVKSETHGFRRHEERGLDGFVDGTENPQGDDIARIGIIADEQCDAGGSYVLFQKYRHDLKKWNAHTLAEQEEAVARTKQDDIEFSKSERAARSHIARVNLKENGVGLKIVRRSLPYGQASGEHGLMFIAYAARLHNIEAQLKSMFGDTEDGLTDLLLERLSSAVSGAYYFAPSIERLRNL